MKKGIDLHKLKEALDNGSVFEENNKLNEIFKKAEYIDMLPEDKKKELLENRDERLNNEWDKNEDKIIKEIREDSEERMKKRSVYEKNEMNIAKIKFLTNEILVFEEYEKQLKEELEKNKSKIDNLNTQINVLNKDI